MKFRKWLNEKENIDDLAYDVLSRAQAGRDMKDLELSKTQFNAVKDIYDEIRFSRKDKKKLLKYVKDVLLQKKHK